MEVHLSNALNEGRITEDWLREQIAAWDAAHPEDALLKTGSRQNLIEAASTLGKAYFANKVKARALPPSLAKFFRQLSAIFRQFFIRATKLKQSLKDGTLSPEFEAMLEESLGFGGKGDPAPSGSSSRDFLAAGDLLSNSFRLSKSSPERDARSLVPLKITTAPLAGGRSDWRRSVRTYIATYLQGKTLTNKDSQMAIRFNAESKAEAPSKLRNEPSFRAAHEIHDITEQAIHLGSVTPEKGRDQDTARFDYFALPVEIDGARSFAWFNTRQTVGGGENIFYEFGLFKPNKAARATQGPSANKQNLQPVAPQPGPELTVADFLAQIKDELPAFLKVASENTPTAAQAKAPNPTSFSIDSVAGSVVERRANDRVEVISIPDRVPSLKRSDAMHMLSARGEMSVVGFHLNVDSGITYEVDGYTLSKTVVQPLKEGEPEGSHRVRIAAPYSLPEIIRKAIAIPVTDSKTERGATSVKDLFSAIRWNGNLYRVRIKGIESTDGNHHARSLKIQDIIIENAPSNTEASEGAGFPESAAKANRDTNITVRQLFQAVNPYTGKTFSISGQVDHQKISSILNGTYEATTEDHLAARSFERSIRQSPQLLKEFGGHTPKARPISHLDRKECQIGAAIGVVFQKRIGLFDTGDVIGPGGRYSSELPDQIFFNSNKKSPFHLGVGHELWHSLTVQDHRIASGIESLIAENVDAGRLDNALRAFESAYGDHAVQEVVANIFATAITEYQFWQQIQTPYATEIANALKALPKNAAYDEAKLIKDWPTFVKEVANLLRPKEQNPQQRSLLSDPSSTEGNESGKPESSFSISDDPMHGISSDTNSLAPQTKRSEPIDSNGPEVYKINDITDEILRILPGELAKNAGAFQEAAKALERRGGEETSGTAPQRGTTRTLEEWAKEEGRLIPAEEIDGLPLISNSTSEHEVHYRVQDGRAVKRTWPGFYGQIPAPENGKLGRKNATPSEYLRRMAWQIAVFGSDLRLEGVTVSDKPSLIIGEPAGQPSIVISQGWIEKAGSKPLSLQDIAEYLETKGFKEVQGSYFGWHHPPTGIVIIDAKPDNFIFSSVGVLPLDLQIFRLSAKELQAAGLSSTDLE